MRFVSGYRLGDFGQQTLPADFDKMSPEEKVKFIDALPPEQKGKALAEIFYKLPLDKQREWIELWQNVAAYERDTKILAVTTLASFAFDAFVLIPSEESSRAKRTAANLGSAAVAGLSSYHAYRVLTNPVSANFAKVASAFVAVFMTVDVVLGVLAVARKEKVTSSPILSPKTSIAVAVSGKR